MITDGFKVPYNVYYIYVLCWENGGITWTHLQTWFRWTFKTSGIFLCFFLFVSFILLCCLFDLNVCKQSNGPDLMFLFCFVSLNKISVSSFSVSLNFLYLHCTGKDILLVNLICTCTWWLQPSPRKHDFSLIILYFSMLVISYTGCPQDWNESCLFHY